MTSHATAPRGIASTLVAASRPLSWINTAYPFAAAYLMTARQLDVALVVGALFFLVPYNLAMYGVNDVYDYESDAANPRKGGVEGALLPPDTHRIVLASAALLAAPTKGRHHARMGPARVMQTRKTSATRGISPPHRVVVSRFHSTHSITPPPAASTTVPGNRISRTGDISSVAGTGGTRTTCPRVRRPRTSVG